MPYIAWSQEFSVGVDAIDADHRLLVSMINQLHDTIADGQGQEIVGSILNALLEYTGYHFGREEVLMEAFDYPELDEHRTVHEKLKAKVEDIRRTYLEDETSILGEDVLEFLKQWLPKHILGTDKKLQPFLEGREAEIKKINRAYSEKLIREFRYYEVDLDFI